MAVTIERRQELVSQSKVRCLTVDEVEELQAILYKELRHSYATEQIGLLAYLGLHTLINHWAYMLKMEAL